MADIAKERRATRKAAAACLARQRHKTFVNSLQEQGNTLRSRIEFLKRRRGHAAAAAAACMVERICNELPEERLTDFKQWIANSPLETLTLQLPPPPVAPPPPLPSTATPQKETKKGANEDEDMSEETYCVSDGAAGGGGGESKGKSGGGGGGKHVDRSAHARSLEFGGGAAEDENRAAAAFDAELSKQLFFEQLASSTAHLPSPWPKSYSFAADFEDGDDFEHYDGSMGLTPHPAHPHLPPNLSAHLAATPPAVVSRTSSFSSAAAATNSAAHPSHHHHHHHHASAASSSSPPHSMLDVDSALLALDSDASDAHHHHHHHHHQSSLHHLHPAAHSPSSPHHHHRSPNPPHHHHHHSSHPYASHRPSPLTAAYGEGFRVLLGHLAASRQPQVQAWLQLKEELVAADEGLNQGWDDLNDLEEEYIALNQQHLASKSWLTTMG